MCLQKRKFSHYIIYLILEFRLRGWYHMQQLRNETSIALI